MRLRAQAALAALFCVLTVDLSGQTLPLVFTAPAPPPASTPVEVRAEPVVAERGLAMWAGASDFGLGVDVTRGRWSFRSIESLNIVPLEGRRRPTFQQIEIVRPMFARASLTVAAGAGLREEWDGTRVLLGRAIAGVDAAGGRLQGSFILERAVASPVRRDAADVVTTAGWSGSITSRFALGVEGIGQDLEGFWDPGEADGGARLLVGPSIRVRSRRGDWSASATAGPVIRSVSTVVRDSIAPQAGGGHHFGVFASASWMPR